MRGRRIVVGLYGDEADLAWARELVTARARASARRAPVRAVLRPDTGGHHEELAEQWGHERPGVDPGPRRTVELTVRVACSRRSWLRLRRELPALLCPAGAGPHVCRTPWSLGW
ncbi:hypothetical protein ACN20G_30635 (plasmid) [Streptomyces sp. BI20]|uniref:hypothetical protein n=1 Tax=Streptomyces sp. BI20 TaxID=3403460 RepID=UPI003C736FBB